MHGIASVIGPGLGSFIIDFTSTWHWLFFINVPIGIILLFIGYFSLKETKAPVLDNTVYLGINILSLTILTVIYSINNYRIGIIYNCNLLISLNLIFTFVT